MNEKKRCWLQLKNKKMKRVKYANYQRNYVIYPLGSPIMSTSLSSSDSSSLDFIIRSSDDTLLNTFMDDWPFIGLLFIVEYNVSARSASPLLFPLPGDENEDGLAASLREKSTGSDRESIVVAVRNLLAERIKDITQPYLRLLLAFAIAFCASFDGFETTFLPIMAIFHFNINIVSNRIVLWK